MRFYNAVEFLGMYKAVKIRYDQGWPFKNIAVTGIEIIHIQDQDILADSNIDRKLH